LGGEAGTTKKKNDHADPSARLFQQTSFSKPLLANLIQHTTVGIDPFRRVVACIS
jgi:hypothetical protein